MYLPLTNNTEEKFKIVIFNVVYEIKQLWNINGFWTLDIKDVNGEILIAGIKIVTKLLLLQQYPYIPFDLKSEKDDDPNRNNLSEFQLQIINKNV